MFILDGFEGTRISLDFQGGDLFTVLSLLADAAREDGLSIFIDKRIKGNIQITMNEPWNFILIEILAGVDFTTTIVDNVLAVSLMSEGL